MKLNPDCIRDVLIYLEEHLEYVERDDAFIEHQVITLYALNEDLHTTKGYEYSDIVYSIEKLIEVGYIKVSHIAKMADNSRRIDAIEDITWQGHQFLNNIRSQTVWEATKKGASKLGMLSLHALSTISMKVVETVISKPEIIGEIASYIK